MQRNVIGDILLGAAACGVVMAVAAMLEGLTARALGLAVVSGGLALLLLIVVYGDGE